MPYGYGVSRENALCPGCLALECHRLLYLYLTNETDMLESKPRMLHIAPEHCYMKLFKRCLGDNYVTADLESPLADIKMDIQNMPVESGSFDVVFCNHVLEHVDNDRMAISEIYRVMRSGGWGILLSPVNYERETTYEDAALTTPEQRMAAFGQYDHKREYGRDYGMRLAEAGFDVEEIDYIRELTDEQIQRFWLRREIIYRVNK
jgi:SAM-dependent methyltransferase